MRHEQPELLSEDSRADIQGFITSGYGHLPLAIYLFVRFHEADGARRWLNKLEPLITSGKTWPRENGMTIKPRSALNVAMTASGLLACGLPPSVLCTFPVEFREGIAVPARSRVLGDTEESSPAAWEVGGLSSEPVHAVVLMHAIDQPELNLLWIQQRALFEQSSGAVTEIADSAQHGYRPDGDYEPFGFHDGITQPKIVGFDGGTIPTGEFVLGYQNHYNIFPPTPVVPGALDPGAVLPKLPNPHHFTKDLRDLGRHGSYVVYRKLQQDVAGFWQFMQRESTNARGVADAGNMVRLAAKCMGRWPSGAPLALAPSADNPRLSDADEFRYSNDPDGFACPIGAHVRRTNPRDAIKPYEAEQAQHMSNAHRLLRRARVFGLPLFDATLLRDVSSADNSSQLLQISDDGVARGIHFFCVNASIRSQFEFVQQTWCNNPHVGGLRSNKDPIIGDHGGDGQSPSYMTVPAQPSGTRTSPLPRFVTVRAGAYLFMPSLTALRYLAEVS